MLFSVGANAAHGLRRTNEDKRRAVTTLLSDPEWSAWSDSKIATIAKVDHKTVAKWRGEHLGNSQDNERPATRAVERNGTVYQQNTANIGRRAEPITGPAKRDAMPAPVRSTVGEAMRAAPPGPTPLQQRHIGLALARPRPTRCARRMAMVASRPRRGRLREASAERLRPPGRPARPARRSSCRSAS